MIVPSETIVNNPNPPTNVRKEEPKEEIKQEQREQQQAPTNDKLLKALDINNALETRQKLIAVRDVLNLILGDKQ
jgi:hypothetical protein